MTIRERYMICKDCEVRIQFGKCDGKCKEYWQYQGAREQRRRDIEAVTKAVQSEEFIEAFGKVFSEGKWTPAYLGELLSKAIGE